MFWTDLYGDDIRRANLDGSNMTVLVNTGLSAPGRSEGGQWDGCLIGAFPQ